MPDDSSDEALADIEAELASDRAFTRRVTKAQSMMGSHAPSWGSMGASGLLLLLSCGFLVGDVRLNQPWLMFPCVACFAVAMRPMLISMSRRNSSGDDERER